MKTAIVLIIILFLITTIITGCAIEAYVEIDGQIIDVELPKTASEKSKGLMYRENLCDSCGMLFVTDREARHSFWMKNTLIPLDMVFIDSDLVIVDVLHAEPCTEDPCKHYTPKEDALYILETNVNMFDDSIIGQKVNIVLR